MAAHQTGLPAAEKRPLGGFRIVQQRCRSPGKHAIPAAIPKAAPPTMKNTLRRATAPLAARRLASESSTASSRRKNLSLGSAEGSNCSVTSAK